MDAKIEDWIETVKDETVRKLIRRDTIVTGGSIVSLLIGEPINDFDVYFKTKETTLAVAKYYVDLWNANPANGNQKWNPPVVREREEVNIKGETETLVEIYVESSGIVQSQENIGHDGYDMYSESGIEESAKLILDKALKPVFTEDEEQKESYRVVYMSANAITLSDSVQLITRFYGEPEQIHKNFDFTHAMSWYDHSSKNVVTPEKTLQCILSKTLHYSGSLYPIASIFRAKKFIERGWRISAGDLVKMCFQISTLDLNDLSVLKQQLTGVDMMYLHQLVGAISTYQKNNSNTSIDDFYIVEIIDRIFGV